MAVNKGGPFNDPEFLKGKVRDKRIAEQLGLDIRSLGGADEIRAMNADADMNVWKTLTGEGGVSVRHTDTGIIISAETSTGNVTVSGDSLWERVGRAIHNKNLGDQVLVGTKKYSEDGAAFAVAKNGETGEVTNILEIRNVARADALINTGSMAYFSFVRPSTEKPVVAGGIAMGMESNWVTASTEWAYVTSQGAYGTATNQYWSPNGIATDGTYLYIAENGNRRVKKVLASTLAYVAHIGTFGTGNDKFFDPIGICYADGYIYIADKGNDRIVKRSASDLSYVSKYGTTGSGNDNLSAPWGICTDGTYLYIVDKGNNRIVKRLCSDLTYVAKYGSTGTGNTQFNYPLGIATDGTYLYIADSTNNRIKVHLCSDLSYYGQFGSFGSGNGQFNGPEGVLVTADYAYVVDITNNRIQKFHTLTYEYISKYGSVGSGQDQLSDPSYITILGNNIYITDTGNHRIMVRAVSETTLETCDAYQAFYVSRGSVVLEAARFTKDAYFAVGKKTASEMVDVDGNIKASGQFISSALTGIAPLSVSSTTAVTNLNVDMLDGYHAASFVLAAGGGTANQLLGMNAAATALEYKTISGTANRVTVTHGAGTIALSGPQDIHSAATPTFGGMALAGDLGLTWVTSTNRKIEGYYSATYYWGLYFTETTRKLELKIQSNDTGGNIYLTPSAAPSVGSVYIGTLSGLLKCTSGAVAAIAHAAGWLHNDGAGVFAYSTPTAANVGAEPALGNPAVTGYVLSSTDAGVRSWISPLANPMNAVGDIIYGGAAGVPTKLADVAVGSYLASGGVTTAPLWATLNQAAVAGLKTTDGPSFAHVHATDAPATGGAFISAAESWIGPSATVGIYFKGGNVGIGTTSPGSVLSVVGDSLVSIPALGANGGQFSVLGTGGLYGLIGGVLGSGNVYLQTQRVDGTPTGYNLLLQPTTGNVGIGTTTVPSMLTVAGLINMKNYTAATLPAGTRGDVCYVTDALAPTFLATIVAGGAIVAPAFYNGTNWVGF